MSTLQLMEFKPRPGQWLIIPPTLSKIRITAQPSGSVLFEGYHGGMKPIELNVPEGQSPSIETVSS